MFNKILIANRGEIACRAIATANKMGIRTVAVFSDADSNAMHVQMADEAIYIGASASAESYLQGNKVIAAALETGAQAIHPGYGFLSENAEFAELCQANKLIFIGPPVDAIKAMGSKSAAKTIMENADVPLVPGYHGDKQDAATLKKHADKMGYPVLLKAVAGGGGKGMRQVWSSEEFEQAFSSAKSEAKASFGDDDMLVEKYLTQPRHVEVQVFCDAHGKGVYLFERDCSVQRRHQKIIEEAPAPNLSAELRHNLGETAIQAAKAINYEGAGTVEFLLDVDGSFYFMEMNTRLQVEHPVTEMITGQDLVEWQLRVANSEVLPLQQSELKMRGHAFEARIYAEDPNNDFLPATGQLIHLQTPLTGPQVRVDTGVREGDEVSPFYDPMIAKLIVWGEDRESALSRMSQALSHYQIAGVTTNIDFLRALAAAPAFINADLDTGFIEKNHDALFTAHEPDATLTLAMAGLYLRLKNESRRISNDDPWSSNNSWRMNQANQQRFKLSLADEPHEVIIEEEDSPSPEKFKLQINGEQIACSGRLNDKTLEIQIGNHQLTAVIAKHGLTHTIFCESFSRAIEFSEILADFGEDGAGSAVNDYSAPMNGTVVEVLVEAGTTVQQGDVLVVLEAMKMQHSITANYSGRVTGVFYQAGDLVDGGASLLDFEPAE